MLQNAFDLKYKTETETIQIDMYKDFLGLFPESLATLCNKQKLT